MKINALLQSIVTDAAVDPLYYVGYPIEGHHGLKVFCKYYLDQTPFLIPQSKIAKMIETCDSYLHYLDLSIQDWAENDNYNAVAACVDGQWYVIPMNQVCRYQSIQYKGMK